VGKTDGKRLLDKPGRIILKCILRKLAGRAWTDVARNRDNGTVF
jgi:hypothetical protein